jgi:3-phenylpropionate/trans-cinnamate dioxygenase ferredoxin subunit
VSGEPSTAQGSHGRVRVCAETDLEVGEARRFDIDDLRLALVRGEDRWFALDDECSHADYSLAEGEVDLDECTLECWKHGSLFSLTTGEAETLPATRPVKVYDVTVEAGEVSVALPTTQDAS